MTRLIVERIQVPSSIVPGEKPPGTLKHGELWVNTADGLIYAGVDGAAPEIVGDKAGGTFRLNSLVNVSTTPAAVAAASQGGVLIRDTSVASEADPAAYKITTEIDAGVY